MYTSTRKRVAYCAAIVKQVYVHGTSDQKIALGQALTDQSFEDRSLQELVYLAAEFGVANDAIDRCEEESDDTIREPTYLCPHCLDQWFVQVPGHPDRYMPCSNCNPSEPQEEPDARTDDR